MPITESRAWDFDTEFTRALVNHVKNDQRPWREAAAKVREAKRLAAVAAAEKEERRARMREIASRPRGRKPGSRPWQSAGFASRADWVAAGSPTGGAVDG